MAPRPPVNYKCSNTTCGYTTYLTIGMSIQTPGCPHCGSKLVPAETI